MTPAPVSTEWLRSPADDLAVAQGCTFDHAAGERACAFVESFCRQSKGRWAGQTITLLAWQRDLLMRLFGWKRADGKRRYRRCYVEVAKKNGKSTLVSALNLYLLLADGEGAPEIYLNACDRNQARIIFDESKRMVEASPDLRRYVTPIESRARLVCTSNNGVVIANSADAPNKDGLNPSAVIFDELHRQPGRDLWDVFEYAQRVREQPLTISITTAGEDEDGVWYEQRKYSERVNAGEVPDTTHLGVVYRAEEGDDLDDPATWAKANPSLGDTIRVEDFARELAEAKEVPVKLNNFKRLRLNLIARAAAKYFDLDRWDACAAAAKLTTADLAGLPGFLGLDLSTTNDFTALVALALRPDGKYLLLSRFWCPEGNLAELERQTRMPYRMWAEHGYLIPTPGETIDYGFVRREINDIAGAFDLQKLLIDRHNATQIALELRDADGIPLEFLQQGFLSLNAPTKELARLIKAGLVEHDDNPVMRWCVGNAVADTDAADNVKLTKKKSRLKIDGAAAAVNAVAAAIAGEAGAFSVYNDRGPIFL